MFCYCAASYPRSSEVIEGMKGKRIVLVMSSEETFPMVSASIISQFQEFSRYTRSQFVGVVLGYGNTRGDIERDPSDPVASARRFGREFLTRHTTDCRIDTPRAASLWG